jgi:hypothetical protein
MEFNCIAKSWYYLKSQASTSRVDLLAQLGEEVLDIRLASLPDGVNHRDVQHAKQDVRWLPLQLQRGWAPSHSQSPRQPKTQAVTAHVACFRIRRYVRSW